MGGVMNKIRLPPIIRDELDGIAGSFGTAKSAAEAAHQELGFTGVVTKLISPHGIEWRYTPREDNRSGSMVWRRIA